MYLHADLTQPSPVFALCELDDFGSFKVILRGSVERLADALGPRGAATGAGDVLLEVDWLLEVAGGRAGDDAWREAFDGMLDHARAHGWTSDDGRLLQAHCEVEASGRAR